MAGYSPAQQAPDRIEAKFVVSDGQTPAPTATFISAEGESIKLDAYSGQLVLINFWASWCAPCIRELPSLSALREAIPDSRFRILLVSLDRHGDARKHAAFLKRLKISNLASASDIRGELLRSFKAPGIPISVLIGADGKIVGRLVGDTDWSAEAAVALIRRYLPEG